MTIKVGKSENNNMGYLGLLCTNACKTFFVLFDIAIGVILFILGVLTICSSLDA